MAFWRRRDHENFIGSYDPEHEMPDPDRRPRDRYESEAYRHNARDGRYGYRWDPDRVEGRYGMDRDRGMDIEHDRNWNRDARDRFYEDRWRQSQMGRGGYDRDRGMMPPRDYERGARFDRGWDYDRDDRGYGSDYRSGSYGTGYGRDYDAERFRDDRDYDRGMDRDRNYRGRMMPDWDREDREARDRDYGWEDVGDIPYDRNRGRRY